MKSPINSKPSHVHSFHKIDLAAPSKSTISHPPLLRQNHQIKLRKNQSLACIWGMPCIVNPKINKTVKHTEAQMLRSVANADTQTGSAGRALGIIDPACRSAVQQRWQLHDRINGVVGS